LPSKKIVPVTQAIQVSVSVAVEAVDSMPSGQIGSVNLPAQVVSRISIVLFADKPKPQNQTNNHETILHNSLLVRFVSAAHTGARR